jgi:hypothetical protein
MDICIFCFQGPDNPKPFCPDNPGEGCTYGSHHEYPGSIFSKMKPPPKVIAKKVDKQICVKCLLHRKHPTSATNGCEHEYPT